MRHIESWVSRLRFNQCMPRPNRGCFLFRKLVGRSYARIGHMQIATEISIRRLVKNGTSLLLPANRLLKIEFSCIDLEECPMTHQITFESVVTRTRWIVRPWATTNHRLLRLAGPFLRELAMAIRALDSSSEPRRI